MNDQREQFDLRVRDGLHALADPAVPSFDPKLLDTVRYQAARRRNRLTVFAAVVVVLVLTIVVLVSVQRIAERVDPVYYPAGGAFSMGNPESQNPESPSTSS
jgi:hypothetical protein